MSNWRKQCTVFKSQAVTRENIHLSNKITQIRIHDWYVAHGTAKNLTGRNLQIVVSFDRSGDSDMTSELRNLP